jgi:hypothetical protein
MEEFEISMEYKGEEKIFKSSLIVTGYSHKFNVDVEGQNIMFEPDEERNYRAVLNYEDIDKNKKFDVGLLKEISKKIEEMLR